MSKINISLNEDFLKKLDYYSGQEEMTRSKFIREAVVEYITIKEKEKLLLEKRKKIDEAIKLFRNMGAKNKGWDGVKELNKWRDRVK